LLNLKNTFERVKKYSLRIKAQGYFFLDLFGSRHVILSTCIRYN